MAEKELQKLVNVFPKTTIVLDALDECDKDTRHQILEIFRNIAERTTRNMKVLISSRPDQDIVDSLKSGPNIGIIATHNQADIAKFVTESIHVRPKDSPDLRYWRDKIPEKLRSEICEVLIEKSDGM